MMRCHNPSLRSCRSFADLVGSFPLSLPLVDLSQLHRPRSDESDLEDYFIATAFDFH